ncbi:MAG: P1 family peptidase [Clostridiales bacterium]|nr:P1 family peptidase [Clostridiales bacterium]
MKQEKIRDFNITIGNFQTGKFNKITDVPGVLVGHSTISNESNKTGVTIIKPHPNNTFENKVIAAANVINGFGKSTGLLQIDELATIETPIVLTNTLSVGTAFTAIVEYMMINNPNIGITDGTVNPIITECNDGYLNNIRSLSVKDKHVLDAINHASDKFLEGSLGAGTGMSCFGLKGGIGSSSRIIELNGKLYTLGTLVLTNFGKKEDLIIKGQFIGKEILKIDTNYLPIKEQGSIIVIIATDIPLIPSQLKRIAKRASVGISRTGGHIGHGSGEIAIAFTTKNQVKHHSESPLASIEIIHHDYIDDIFNMTIESVEESILNSMITSNETVGFMNHKRHSLEEYIHLYHNRVEK